MNGTIDRNNRQIVRRIIVEGDLVLLAPAHFGNGDAEGATDMPLLLDPLDGKALLTGASIAGALRNYLWEREWGYEVAFDRGARGHARSMAMQLLGGAQADPDGGQSSLIVEDALGGLPEVELRDGVRIDPATRTAAEGAKFDFELLRAGTVFPLRFELLVPHGQEMVLRQALATALSGLEAGEITLGARKRRGFGECRARNWRVIECDLTAPAGRGLLAWLDGDGSGMQRGDDISTLLGVEPGRAPDQRRRLRLQAAFWLDGSLLVRSGFGEADTGPDAVHLHRPEAGRDRRAPILPGTSLAGAMRQRALRIAQTLHGTEGAKIVDRLFGHVPEGGADESYTGSRIEVRETLIGNVRSLVQNRIRVDRFTGGVLDNFLFNEAPVFGGPASLLSVDLIMRNPKDHEIGLLVLVLKDLWTSDLPLGGGANVGRGRLHGLRAQIEQHLPGQEVRRWTIEQAWEGRSPGRLQVIGEAAALEGFVRALNTEAQA